jgi:pilin isopeptide linkage protein
MLVAGETASFEAYVGARYHINEILDPSDGYILTSVIGGQGTLSGETVVDGALFTNTYINPLMTTIEGQKSWDLRGIKGMDLPDSISVQLIDSRDGSVVRQQMVTSADDWLFSFIDVDATDEKGKSIPYTVKEVPVPYFSSTVAEEPKGYFTVTNTYLPPVTVDAPFVTKQMVPSSAPSEIFTFALRPQGEAPLPVGSSLTESIITIKGSGAAQFGTITFSESGIYVYHISEVIGSASGFAYDKTVYRLEYDIIQVEKQVEIEGEIETIYTLEPEASLTRLSDGKSVTSAEFVNKYTKLPGSDSGSKTASTAKTGDTTNVMFWIIWLILATGTVAFALLVRSRSHEGKGN